VLSKATHVLADEIVALPLLVAAAAGVVTRLRFFVPSGANLFNPVLVASPIVELIGDCSVTVVGLARTLWHRGCWFHRSRFDAWRFGVHLWNSTPSFAVAHLARLVNLRDTRCRSVALK